MDNVRVARELVEVAGILGGSRQAGSIPAFRKFVDRHSVDDYPYGRERTTAEWYVEEKGKKARVCRVTVNPKTGRTNKPSCTTYGSSAVIGLGTDGRAYPIVGKPGQIGVYSGDMKHMVGSAFAQDSDYNDLADALGFRIVPGKITVKETRDGAEIDGLQGKTTTIREILNLGGLTNEVIDSELEKVNQKYIGRGYPTYVLWTVIFKPEAERENFEIRVFD